MSTNSNIVLRLRKEDTNKTFHTPWGEPVEMNGFEFLEIYCHWDGYHDGVGADLAEMCEEGLTYEQALDFMLEGNRSTTEQSYWAMCQEECPPDVVQEPEHNFSYLYLLEETEDGKMKVTFM